MAVSLGELDGGDSRNTGMTPLAGLLPALQRLDTLLDWAAGEIQSTHSVSGPAPFQGLYITPEEVSRLLKRKPGASVFTDSRPDLNEATYATHSPDTPLDTLVSAFELTTFDIDVILIALAPDLDLRYERLYAYLQDDVTKKRPSIDLALNLLCASAEEKIQRRSHFYIDAPLLQYGLLHLVLDPNQAEPPFLAHYLRLDSHVVRFLLGEKSLDPSLRGSCELITPNLHWDQTRMRADLKEVLPFLAAQAFTTHQPLRLIFQGPPDAGKCRAAQALAGSVGANLLTADLSSVAEKLEFERLVTSLDREARLQDAILYLRGTDALQGNSLASQRRMLEGKLEKFPGTTILAGRNPLVPEQIPGQTVLTIAFEPPALVDRLACWQHRLAAREIEIPDHEVANLASRFRLTESRIDKAINHAIQNAVWRAAKSAVAGAGSRTTAKAQPALEDFYDGARTQSGHELSKLARKIELHYSWSDIVLPDDPVQLLHEICAQAEYRHVVYGSWGFDRKLSLGKGLNVLFSGPPGTGKTMAAEVIAHDLRLNLYRIDLSQVISKYIGETEKNLDSIFRAAETSNSILLFDEADALFGKRSEVRDSHDRYANIEISYLLQRMEEYQGVSVLATNLRQNLDEAFVRRLQAIVEFPFPDEEHRRRIWMLAFPADAPVGEDVDFECLAQEVKLAGGNIKNMALAAAFYAAADGGTIHMQHLIRAARREHQKLGRSWDEFALVGRLEAAC